MIIKLHHPNQNPVWVNTDKIVYMTRRNYLSQSQNTYLRLVDCNLDIDETPEQIECLIRESFR